MILLNDASLHGQFSAFPPFQESLKIIFEIRRNLKKRGHTLIVSRSFRAKNVTANHTLNNFLGSLPQELRRLLLIWLDRDGPFWEDNRKHDPDEYFQCRDQLVTDSSLAEAAHSQILDADQHAVISFAPSAFLENSLVVSWLRSSAGNIDVVVRNGWTVEDADAIGAEFEARPQNWDELLEWCIRACPNLLLSSEIRHQLGVQFVPYVAKRAQVLLSVLNEIVECLNQHDDRAFLNLKREWMEGEESRFSPSSESELNDFKNDLTFTHQESGQKIVCSWHGKIKNPQYRIHFQWPLPEGSNKLFVAYIGPKITKR